MIVARAALQQDGDRRGPSGVSSNGWRQEKPAPFRQRIIPASACRLQTSRFAMLDFQERLLQRVVEICGGFEATRSHFAVREHGLRGFTTDTARAENDRRRVPRVGVVEGSATNYAVHRGQGSKG